MLINSILAFSQKVFGKVYEKSFVLQNLDWLILSAIIMLIFSFGFASSDSISYFAIVTILLSIIKLLFKKGERFEITFAEKFLLLYFVVVLISLFGSTLFYLSLKGFMKTLIYLSFYISLVHFFKDNKDKVKYVLLAISLVTVYETVIAFLQNFASVSEISGWQDTSRLNPEEIMTRVYGTIKPYNPNLFGGFLVACIPALLGLCPFGKKYLPLYVIAGLGGILAIVFTGCRGAYIACFLQILTLILITYKFLGAVYKKLFLGFVSLFSSIASVIILYTSSLRARIFSIFAMRSDSSNSFRFNVYNSCIDMFKDNWLLGIGVGNQNFREIYGLYMKTGFDALSAYNIYLETAVESGIFALIAFLAFLISNIVSAIKFIFTNKSKETLYILAALVSVIGVLAHGFVDTVFFRPQIQFTFWIMISIIRTYTRKGEVCRNKE